MELNIPSGFELVQRKLSNEVEGELILLRHIKTGALILKVANSDENRTFAVAFRTPVSDSTGVAHILEHSVLAGSRNFPLKDPFFEMLKGSLHTFLNAYTGADITTYPVASQNGKDFINLMRVYLDAVFFPNLTRDTFLREGWHYKKQDSESPLEFGGIVFNEMKGSFASPSYHHYQGVNDALFPGTHYEHDSGGNPQFILDLTHEQLVNFHKQCYHPSNGVFLIYGAGEIEAEFKLLGGYLDQFAPIKPLALAAKVDLSKLPRRLTREFPIGVDGDPKNSAWVTVNWVLGESRDVSSWLRASFLSEVLAGIEGAPLRRKLQESGLGDDVVIGFSSSAYQSVMTAGVRGADETKLESIEQLIDSTLAEIAESGVDGELLKAALNSFEFSQRNEANAADRGMRLVHRLLDTWLYDGEPFAWIESEPALQRLRSEVEQDGSYVQRAIKELLLQNNHRATLVLSPQPGLQAKLDQIEAKRLEAYQAKIDAATEQEIVNQTKRLAEHAVMRDPPEVLAKLPALTRADLDPKVKTIPTAICEKDPRIIQNPIPAHGICYFGASFDLQHLSGEELSYASLLSNLLFATGTESESYDRFAIKIARDTGGISSSPSIGCMRTNGEIKQRFTISGRALQSQFPNMLQLISAGLLTPRLDTRDRIRDIVRELRVGFEQSLVPSGHAYAARRAAALHHPIYKLHDQIGGIEYLKFVRKVEKEIETNWQGVQDRLRSVCRSIFGRAGVLANICCDQREISEFTAQISPFLDQFPEDKQAAADHPALSSNLGEGFAIPAAVNYVAQALNLYKAGYKFHGSMNAFTNFLFGNRLLELIRFKGGAYGAGCSFDQDTGVFLFRSYRDPHLLETLAVYESTPEYLGSLTVDDLVVTRSVIGAIGGKDTPLSVEAKSKVSFDNYIHGRTDERRQLERDELLATQVANFKSLAPAFANAAKSARVCVLGSKATLEEVNSQRAGLFSVVEGLL